MASNTNRFVCIEDYEKHAAQVLPSSTLEYYKGGADQEQTLQDNHDAFKRWRLMPRMLKGVQNRSIETTAIGLKVSAPFGIAPTAMHKLAHQDGECATAKAAAEQGIVYVMSTFATSSFEEIAQAAPEGNNWFQLCVFRDRQITVDMIRRAERSNFKALVVTVDIPVPGRRLGTLRNPIQLPPNLSMGNFNVSEKDPSSIDDAESGKLSRFMATMYSLFDPTLTWKDIDWLKSITTMPIVVKGILRADDAELAIHHGVAAIAVSNHGARQFDGVQATIDALPAIVKQVNKRCEVFVDGGITKGTDILKALALGAKMAFVGRPILWGLSHSGKDGVSEVLKLLKKEFDLAMALSGCSSVDEIDSSLVLHQGFLSKI